MHNTALKYLREQSALYNFVVLWFDPDLECKLQIAQIVHGKDTAFHFSYDRHTLWHWQEMVAQLDDEPIQCVVQGVHPTAVAELSNAASKKPTNMITSGSMHLGRPACAARNQF